MGKSVNTTVPSGQAPIADTFSWSNTGTSGTSAARAGQSAIKGTFSLSNSGTSGTSVTPAGPSAIKGTFSLASTGTSATSGGKPSSLTTTGTNLTAATGGSTGTTPNSSTGSTTTSPVTNPNGTAHKLTPAAFALMSELYGAYGYSHYGLPNYGHRSYGSRYYANRGYGNRNNSMYFAQMRNLAGLPTTSNNLSRGSGVSTNMTSRIRGDLMGVVDGNGRPPYQTVHQLSVDLVGHLPNRTTPMINSGQLARDLMVVMNASGHNMSQIQNAIGSANSLMNMSGVNQQEFRRSRLTWGWSRRGGAGVTH